VRLRSFRRAAARLRKRASRRAAYWTAVGTLAAYSAFGAESAAVTPKTPARGGSAQTESQLTVRRFHIPAGPLPAALESFRNVTGVRVTVSQLPDGTLANFQSPGASGFFTNEQALRELLAGTALAYRFASPTAATIFIGGDEEIDVTAHAPSTLATTLPRYNAPLREIPQSISVVPHEVTEQQGTTTLRDALRNVAGISIAAGEGGAQGDNLTIRGFSARNDLFVDGMRDFGSYYRDPFALEELEVLKGPSSVTFGRGSTGGVVNQATKSARFDLFLDTDVTVGTDATRRITADLNEPFGDATAFRLNLMAHDSRVAGRAEAENRRFGIAPSLTTLLGESRLTINYLHQAANDTPDYGVPWYFDTPAPVDRTNYYGFPDANFLRTTADIGTAKLERDLSASTSLRTQLRYASYGRDVQITEAKLATSVTPSTPLDRVTVTRNQIAVESDETFGQLQSDLTANFNTGRVLHSVVAGVEAGRETSDPTRLAFSGVPVTSLLDPDPNQPFAGTAAVSTKIRTTATTVGAYVLDTLHAGPHWDLTAGARWDRFDADVDNLAGAPTTFHRVDAMPSWRGGVVYKPAATGSIYANYSTSFNPSAEALSLSASTADTAPEENRNTELGTKWDLRNGRLSLRGALFRTEKRNARETDPANPLQQILSGRQRVDGIEVEASGHVTERWQLLAGYSHMNSELVKSVGFPAAVGARLANVPDDTFNFWSTLRVASRFEIGAGGQYVGSRTASTTAPLDPITHQLKEAPAYWVFNAMISHPLGDRVRLRLNLYNLTDAYYFDQLHPGHIVPGPGRSASLSFDIQLGGANRN